MHVFNTGQRLTNAFIADACFPALDHRRAVVIVASAVFERIVFTRVAKDVFSGWARRVIGIIDT